jgi:hypothetical protein
MQPNYNMNDTHRVYWIPAYGEILVEVNSLNIAFYLQEWYSNLKTPLKTASGDDSKSDDDFVTASECTCTPPSRSSSFHTASECGGASPWWEVDHMSDVEADGSGKERRLKEESGSDQPSSQSETEKAIVRTVTEVSLLTVASWPIYTT